MFVLVLPLPLMMWVSSVPTKRKQATIFSVPTARMLLRAAGSDAHVVSKIERREALDNMDEIIAASDVIMVARGDLGVEIGDAEVPGVQKRLISESRIQNTVVITATQMMQSLCRARR